MQINDKNNHIKLNEEETTIENPFLGIKTTGFQSKYNLFGIY